MNAKIIAATKKKKYDAIVIGAGHMGIICAAYMQRSGMKVAMFERRHEEGGSIFSSECTAPGFVHNLHAQYLEFQDWMPMYHDFELQKLGHQCILPDTQCGISFSDGRPPIILYNVHSEENMQKTYKSIAQYSKQDADTWDFMRRKILEIEPLIAKMVYSPPVLPTAENPNPGIDMAKAFMDMLGLPFNYLMCTNKEFIDRCFETDELRALMYRQIVEWGQPLHVHGLGGVLSTYFMYGHWRMSVGGTHTLAHAMMMAAIKEGVDVYENSKVVKILIEDGRAVGVRLQSGEEYEATKLVASNANVKQTLLDMVGEENLSPLWVKRAKDQLCGPSCVLSSIALALHEAPKYKGSKYNPDIDRCFYNIVGYDTAKEVSDYCAQAEIGQIPNTPGAGVWVNSLWDPTQAPPGKHNLTAWAFMPIASSHTPEEWLEVRKTWNERFIKHYEKFAPNMTRANVIEDFHYTPYDQEVEMALEEGDFSNGAIRLDQANWMRPFPEAAHYRTEIKGLYMCGPCMYPGGGVSGTAGYCAYKVIAQDYGLKKLWEGHPRGY